MSEVTKRHRSFPEPNHAILVCVWTQREGRRTKRRYMTRSECVAICTCDKGKISHCVADWSLFFQVVLVITNIDLKRWNNVLINKYTNFTACTLYIYLFLNQSSTCYKGTSDLNSQELVCIKLPPDHEIISFWIPKQQTAVEYRYWCKKC